MTHEHLSDCLRTMRWSPAAFADICAVNERTVRCWLSGAMPVPTMVARLLERQADVMADAAFDARV